MTLASNSPRRKALLEDLEWKFEVFTREVDETLPEKVRVEDAAEFLARKKAESYQDIAQNRLVITADTVVVLGKNILGKPRNAGEAQTMLKALSGKNHLVISGVCLSWKDKVHSFSEQTRVFFRDLSEAEIQHYIKTSQPFDKAGSYGIQEWIGKIGISRIEGDYYNVVGLPVSRLYQELNQLKSIWPGLIPF